MPKKLDHTAALEHLSRVDRRLARIIARSGECRLQQETTQSIFEALLESIIYQQLNGKVAATITARVKALFPENSKRIRTRRGLVDGFPSPEQILAASGGTDCARRDCRAPRCWRFAIWRPRRSTARCRR